MDKFVERAKERLLYEFEGGNDDVRLMLERSDVNSRANCDMGRWTNAVVGVCDSWKGNWKGLLNYMGDQLEQKYLILNGYSRVQAIEMRGKSAVAEREVLEKKERGGLLGLFSGNK